MAKITINWDAAYETLKNIAWWASLLDCFEYQREKDGTTEYLARCPAHPDEHPSLVVIHDPHNKEHPVRCTCRAGCSWKDILYCLQERAASQEQDAEADPDMTPPFTQQDAAQGRATSWFETTNTPLWHLAGYCGVSLGWLRDHPTLTVGEDAPTNTAYFIFVGVPGEKAGRVAKGRTMPPPTTEDDGDKKKKGVRWYNHRTPLPPLWPVPPEQLPEEIALTEGETDCILARYWGFEAFSLTGGGADVPDVPVFQELRERGAKRLLIFYDTDATGARCREAVVSACQEVGLEPVPVHLHLMGNPLLGGHKDLRDYRHMFMDPQAAHHAIREVIARSATLLDDVMPNFEEAYIRRPADPGWLMEDLIASGCITILVAKPGLGKTTVLMAYAREAREGGMLLDKAVQPHRILFVTEEGTRSLWKKREQFGPMHHVRLHSVDFEGMDDVDWAEQVRMMADVARRHQCDTIIVDTLFSFAVPEDEDKSSKVRPIFRQLRALTRQGFAVLVTMHGRKSGGAGGDQIAGSIVIPGEADIAIEIAPAEDGEQAHRKLAWIKNRMNPEVVGQPPLTITVEEDRLIVLDDGTGNQDREHKLMDFLGDHLWHSSEDIASFLTITQDQLRRPLENVCRRHRVQKEKCDGKNGRKNTYRYRLERPLNVSQITDAFKKKS